MLYEYNGKIYVKPFSNKIVEVEIEKKGNEYDVKATKNVVEITSIIQKKLAEISLDNAFRKLHKSDKDTF